MLCAVCSFMEITRDELFVFLQKFGVKSLAALKAAAQSLTTLIAPDKAFADFYNWNFEYYRNAQEEQKKFLPVSTAAQVRCRVVCVLWCACAVVVCGLRMCVRVVEAVHAASACVLWLLACACIGLAKMSGSSCRRCKLWSPFVLGRSDADLGWLRCGVRAGGRQVWAQVLVPRYPHVLKHLGEFLTKCVVVRTAFSPRRGCYPAARLSCRACSSFLSSSNTCLTESASVLRPAPYPANTDARCQGAPIAPHAITITCVATVTCVSGTRASE